MVFAFAAQSRLGPPGRKSQPGFIICRAAKLFAAVSYRIDRGIVHRIGTSVLTYKNNAGAEKLAGLRQFSRNAPGVENGSVLIGELDSDPVWKEAVFVEDVKEVSHSGPIRSDCWQLPVTNV
jgi:hypothetical protein